MSKYGGDRPGPSFLHTIPVLLLSIAALLRIGAFFLLSFFRFSPKFLFQLERDTTKRNRQEIHFCASIVCFCWPGGNKKIRTGISKDTSTKTKQKSQIATLLTNCTSLGKHTQDANKPLLLWISFCRLFVFGCRHPLRIFAVF